MKIRRSLLVGGLIALELAFLLAAIWGLNSRAAYIYGAAEVVSIIVVGFLVYSNDNPSYKLTWVIIVLAFPLFGIFIYLIAGTHYLLPSLRKKIKSSRRFKKQVRSQNPHTLERLRKLGDGYMRQAQFVLELADKPVYEDTQARLLTPGESFYDQLLAELEKAQKFIFIEFFILADGEMWNGIFEILRRKAAQGVEIRIIYDDAGSMDRMPEGFREACGRAGIYTAAFNPFMPVLNKFMNYRDHRKIIVIDGCIGFTGGINIGDEYINRVRIHGHWKDSAVMLSGAAVWNFTVMFLDMWILITGNRLFYDRYRPVRQFEGDGFVQPFDDSPFSGNVSEGAYMQLINAAGRYVYISTPYLIIDHEMSVALRNAALGGIDVRIITPHVPDKWYVHMVTRAYYAHLMESGVKIYEYTPGFIHTKMALSDDISGLIGSVNMDYRSFYLQFELSVWLCGGKIIDEMKEDFEKLFDVSQLIDPQEWRKRPLYRRVGEMLLRFFAPLM